MESSTTSTGTNYGWRPGRSPDRNDAPLVLLHGVGLDRSMWEPLARHLGNAHPLLTYDLLGHGGSTNPPGIAVWTTSATSSLNCSITFPSAPCMWLVFPWEA